MLPPEPFPQQYNMLQLGKQLVGVGSTMGQITWYLITTPPQSVFRRVHMCTSRTPPYSLLSDLQTDLADKSLGSVLFTAGLMGSSHFPPYNSCFRAYKTFTLTGLCHFLLNSLYLPYTAQPEELIPDIVYPQPHCLLYLPF